MKRLATLLTVAGISLVAYSGAVYATLGQEMPDSAPEPVFSVQSEPDVVYDIEVVEAVQAPAPQPTSPIVLIPTPTEKLPEPTYMKIAQGVGLTEQDINCIRTIMAVKQAGTPETSPGMFHRVIVESRLRDKTVCELEATYITTKLNNQ